MNVIRHRGTKPLFSCTKEAKKPCIHTVSKVLCVTKKGKGGLWELEKRKIEGGRKRNFLGKCEGENMK